MCARTHFEIFDKNLILHSKFQKKSMLMTQYRLLSHRKWLSIRYWGMLRNALLWGPWSLKFRHLLNRWPWPNIVGCHYCCGPTKPPILDLFAITQYSILSHNKLLSIKYWVIKDTESLYFTISTLCNGCKDNLVLRRRGWNHKHQPSTFPVMDLNISLFSMWARCDYDRNFEVFYYSSMHHEF